MQYVAAVAGFGDYLATLAAIGHHAAHHANIACKMSSLLGGANLLTAKPRGLKKDVRLPAVG